MTRILLIGKNGQVGWELNQLLAPLGELTAVDFPEINLERPDSIRDLLHRIHPTIIVNAAAYTAVDLAETEQERAWKINAIAPGILAEEARKLGAFFIHYSTDYVFDGQKDIPYTEADIPNPLNYYGLSKLEGDNFIQQAGGDFLIFRTSWVYSLRQQRGFVNKVLQWARQNEILRIVDDQIASPTWACLLAEVTSQIIARGSDHLRQHIGLYHLAGGGFTSRFEWAYLILELDPLRAEQNFKQLLPARTADFPTPAQRPLFSALDCNLFEHTFKLTLRPWREIFQLAMEKSQ
jgi:dTDP-4-dehydrorhamnose reductase